MESALENLEALGYSKTEAQKVVPDLFLYLFRKFNQHELRDRGYKINPEIDMFPLLSKLPNKGYITQNDKVCIYARYSGIESGTTSSSYTKLILKNYEVQSHLSKFKSPACTLKQARSLESRAVINKEIDTYIGKFLYRKLSFISNNYGVPSEELKISLQARAIYNLRINYPNWNSAGEMLAMSKSAIANAGHNLIKFYSAEKRAKIDVDNRAIEQSLDYAQELSGDALTHSAIIYSDTVDKGLQDIETKINVKNLLDSVTQPNKNLFLRLLIGTYDIGFSEFLKEDNSDFAEEKEFTILLDKVCDYMSVPLDKAENFLKSLASK